MLVVVIVAIFIVCEYLGLIFKSSLVEKCVIMKIGGDESALSGRYQHLQVVAMLLGVFVIYSLVFQYTLVCCKERGTWRLQNFSEYRHNKQLAMFGDLFLGGNASAAAAVASFSEVNGGHSWREDGAPLKGVDNR